MQSAISSNHQPLRRRQSSINNSVMGKRKAKGRESETTRKEFREFECYADNAKNIFTNGHFEEDNLDSITYDEKVREYKRSGISYSSCKLLRAFHKFMTKILGNEDVPSKKLIGSINQTLRMNECEILTWCFAVYLLIVEDTTFFRIIKSRIENGGKIILKFQTI